MSNTQTHFGRSSGLGGQRMVIAAHTPFRVKFMILALLLFITYVGFTVVSLSPYSKAEFIRVFLNPDFSLQMN